MDIKITQDDINRANKARLRANYDSCTECVMAQAVRRHFKARRQDVVVGWSRVSVKRGKGEEYHQFKISDNARYNVIAPFDGGEEVKPQSVNIEDTDVVYNFQMIY